MCTTKQKYPGALCSGIFFWMISTILVSCSTDHEIEPEHSYVFKQPENFPSATYSFENNPVTKEGFELGRMLFYDEMLSIDTTVSCATCHKQQSAFADPTHKVNHGVRNRFGKRNSPSLANMGFVSFYFFDGGVNHLDFVPVNAITSAFEMDNTMNEVVRRLNRHPQYPSLFNQAFRKDTIDSQQVLHALAQFTVMLVSDNSRYDRMIRNEREQFSIVESEGYEVFKLKCASCHTGELFTDGYFHNNGLDDDFSKDIGRELITESDRDRGKFKVPSLRNIGVTPPYMHDGRFTTLEEVLDHYQHNVKDSPTLDTALRNNYSLGISLSDEEKTKIIAFLKTLTDETFLKDKRFSNPF
jgi:cytochrome c peroxidase